MKKYVLMPILVLFANLVLAKGPTHDQLKAVKNAELLGRAIYTQDHAVSRASDALEAAVSADDRKSVIGWIVLGETPSQTVIFVGKHEGKYARMYQVDVADGRSGSVKALDPPGELTGSDLGMFMARQLALRSMSKSCSTPYNTVVLSGRLAGFDGWLVYLLAASSNENDVPVGGHFRARVTGDGNSLVSIEPLSKSCLTLSLTSDKGPVKALYMTHLLSDTPIETHVFLNLLYGVDFYVATDSSVWGITEGAVRYVGPNKKGK